MAGEALAFFVGFQQPSHAGGVEAGIFLGLTPKELLLAFGGAVITAVIGMLVRLTADFKQGAD